MTKEQHQVVVTAELQQAIINNLIAQIAELRAKIDELTQPKAAVQVPKE